MVYSDGVLKPTRAGGLASWLLGLRELPNSHKLFTNGDLRSVSRPSFPRRLPHSERGIQRTIQAVREPHRHHGRLTARRRSAGRPRSTVDALRSVFDHSGDPHGLARARLRRHQPDVRSSHDTPSTSPGFVRDRPPERPGRSVASVDRLAWTRPDGRGCAETRPRRDSW